MSTMIDRERAEQRRQQAEQRRYMVKQYVAVVQNRRGTRFMVFRTGDEKYYLFCPLNADGCLSTLQFPVRKTELRRDIASALAHGWGNASL